MGPVLVISVSLSNSVFLFSDNFTVEESLNSQKQEIKRKSHPLLSLIETGNTDTETFESKIDI